MPLFAPKNFTASASRACWTGALLSLGVGMVLYVLTAQSIEHDARARFNNQARTAQYSIAAHVKAYTDVLRGAASFFQANDDVSAASFHRYVVGLNLPLQFPAIENINFARYVSDEQRAAFERGSGPGGKALHDGAAPPRIQPPGRRADYAVITLIEPLAPFRHKLGVDIATRAPVAQALAQSRDTGNICASGQPVVFYDHPRRVDLAMRLPVYRNGMPLDNSTQRRAAYFGSIGIGFSVHRLLQAALEEMPVRNVRLSLYDGGTLQAPAAGAMLLFDNQAPGASAIRGGDMFALVLPIDFNGRQWQAHFSALRADWYSGVDAYLPWLALATGFTGSLLAYLLFHALASSRQRAIKMAKSMTRELRDSQAKLQLSHHKLRRLAAHADQIKEQERKRIAREIHDDLGQNLLVLRIEADMLSSRTRHRHPRLHARARSTLGQIDRTIRSVRHIINDLRPPVLDLGLSAAVDWQIAEFRQRSGLVCELIEDEGDVRIDDVCATAFFRVLQESLSNILQHAKASAVRVVLRQQDGMLSMIISDNGVGIRPNSRNKLGSFGLVGVEERIGILGGQCTISGSANGGTTVTVSVPLEQLPAPSGARRMAGSAATA